MLVAPTDFGLLFLLPCGRPRRLAVISAIQDGGRPRLLPRPLARRSRLRIASSICSRSCRNSTRILATSILYLSPRLAGLVFGSAGGAFHKLPAPLFFNVMCEKYQAVIGLFLGEKTY